MSNGHHLSVKRAGLESFETCPNPGKKSHKLSVIQTNAKKINFRIFKVPTVLQNKAILSRYGSSISSFVNPLIELASNQAK